MTQDDVIRLATEAGLCATSNGFVDWIDAGPSLHEMTEFAKLVAEHEREACAKECSDMTWEGPWKSAAVAMSNLIRARGQA